MAMTLDEARTQIVFLRGYLSVAPPDVFVVADGQDYGVTTPVVQRYPDQDPDDPTQYLFFSVDDQARFEAAWQLVSSAAVATGRYQSDPHAWSPLATSAGGGIVVIDAAFTALDWSPTRSVWPWVLGGLAIAGVLAAAALAGAQRVSRPARARA